MQAEKRPFDLDVCSSCEKVFRKTTPEMLANLAIKPALRVVYRVELGGKAKSFLSAKGAYGRYARARLRKKYPCEGHQHHPDAAEYYCSGGCSVPERSHRRFVRWLIWHDRETRKRGHSPFARPE